MSESYAEFQEADGSVRMAGQLAYPQATPSDVLTVQDDGTIAAAAGGGSSSVIVRGPFSFAFDTPGLDAGVAFYTPTAGDVLLDAWIVVDEAFDGTTPKADIGAFIGSNAGWLGNASGNPIDLTQDDTSNSSEQGLLNNYTSTQVAAALQGTIGADSSRTVSPALFVSSSALLLVASQDGSKGGTPIDSTQGAGRVYIITATPVAF